MGAPVLGPAQEATLKKVGVALLVLGAVLLMFPAAAHAWTPGTRRGHQPQGGP